MQMRKLARFLLQSVTVGIAAAIVVLFFHPDLHDGSGVATLHEGTPTTSAPGAASYADAVELASPAVVNIYTTKTVKRRHPLLDDPLFRRFFDEEPGAPRERMESSLGSGVVVSDEGHILTNNHVIAEADAIEVALADGRTTAAEIVGTDPDTDLAVLQVDLDDMPAIRFGQSRSLRVGDVVLAIGNPFGVGQTVTQGIVSATGRTRLGLSTFENFIQTDAAINPGNSGGALINAAGQLVGINTAIFSQTGGSQGIGFATPVSLARDVMTQIIEKGRVVRGWLGVEIQGLTPALAESFGLEGTQGAVVAGVLADGPAARAGLQPGDVITGVGGETVTDVNAALMLISRHEPGETVTISGLRAGEAREWRVDIGERPTDAGRR